MFLLRFAVLTLAVYLAAAQDNSDSEVLEAGFYGLDEQNESEPTELPVPAQPTDLPGSGRGRRPHHRGGHGGHGGRHGHHGHHGMRGGFGNWTDEQKLAHLCSKLQPETTTPGSRGSSGRHSSRIHWKLRSLNETTRQAFITMWNSRKQELQSCCNQATMDAKMQCVNDAKAARYDRVCRGEEPLCMWSALRSASSSSQSSNTTPSPSDNITTRCCGQQGTARVACFVEAKNQYRQRHHSRPSGGRPPRGN